jgi:catechol 2,3-dioxygenase-like lactoylglutathione lyase family enzyme
MSILRLGHYSIRTADLASSIAFYREIFGFRVGFRPNFPFNGAWLYPAHSDADYGIVHLIEANPDSTGLGDYLGQREGQPAKGSAAVDHLAFLADDVDGVRQRLVERGTPFRERIVPDLGLIQIFVEDPSELTIELNFPAPSAPGADAQGVA